MLSLKKLTFNNIGRFITEQVIDFTVFDKLVQVNGRNLNTGGSSGAAKSTIFNAHDYLLGINDIPLTGLQSRLTKSEAYAEAEYDVDGKSLILRRSKKEGLTVKYGDETVSGNAKLAEERLWEIIGIPKKLFKKMIHKKQKEGGFFLNLTAKESYEFLMNALSLEKTSKKTDLIDIDIKAFVNRITQLGHAIDAFTNSIDEIEELQEFEKEPTCTVKDEDIRAIVKELQTVNDTIGEIELKRTDMLEEISITKPVEPVVVYTGKESDDILILQNEVVELDDEKGKLILEHLNKKGKVQMAADSINSKLGKIPVAKMLMDNKIEEMQVLMKEKAHIEEQSCPTCKQKWSGETAMVRVTNIVDSLSAIKTSIIQNKAVVDTEEGLREDLERVNEIISKLESINNTIEIDQQITTLKEKIIKLQANRELVKSEIENKYLKDMSQFKENIRATNASFDLEVNPKKEYIKTLNTQLLIKDNEKKSYGSNLEQYKLKMAKYNATLTEKRENLADAILQRDENTKKLAVAEESKRLIKTYTLQIFQDTLDYIGSYASEILTEIPNMTNTSIYFEGCKENKSGTIKDEVNAIVNMDGYDNINIKTLSGGERTVIDLAVDLAVIDMVESRAGKGANFFILDEPFDGLEDINIAQYLEVLKQVDTNKKIIIVDHNPIAKEMITDTILVERDGEQSVVL